MNVADPASGVRRSAQRSLGVATRAARLLSPNVYIQFFSLLNGLMVSFLFPVAFGMDAYGRFLDYILPTLMIHRVVDTSTESLIPYFERDEMFSGASMSGLAIAAIGTAAMALAHAQGPDIFLLLSMIGTTATLLACYRNDMAWQVVVLLSLFAVTFLALVLARRFAGLQIDLPAIMLIPNVIGTVAGALFLLRRRLLLGHGLHFVVHAWRGVRRIPLSISSTLMMNSILIGYLWLAAPQMGARAIAELRILTALVQASVALFPIGLKVIFVKFSTDRDELNFAGLIKASGWFFLSAFWAFELFAAITHRFETLTTVYLISIPFFWAACLERFAQATGRATPYRWLNGAACAVSVLIALTAPRMGFAVEGYALAIMIYCLALALLVAPPALASRIWAVVLSVAAGVLLGRGRLDGWVVGAAASAVMLIVMRPGPSLLRYYRGRL